MRRALLSLFTVFLLLFGPAALFAQSPTEPGVVRWVNPLTGTGAATTVSAKKHGHGTEFLAQTIPAVGQPFGMTQWTPQTRATETKCRAPYYYTDSLFQGIRATHWLSGSCVQDYGTMTIMPTTSQVVPHPAAWAAPFRHTTEVATPYSYRARLERYDIGLTVTSSRRCGLLQFDYGQADSALVYLMPNSDEAQGIVEIDPERRQVRLANPVHRIYQGWGQPAGFAGYFVIEFDQPFRAYGTFADSTLLPGQRQLQDRRQAGAYLSFAPGTRRVTARIGSSFTNWAGAERNLRAEIPNWDMAVLERQTRQIWEEHLGRLQAESNDSTALTKLYTALYHSLQQPRLYSDVDGSYPGFADDNNLHRAEGYAYYDDFSAWDTFRALHPLINLLYPEYGRDMVRSLVAKAEQGGWMPIFPCWNSYTAAMIGDHLSSIIGDAYVKGIRDFDVQQAYHYLRQNAFETPASYEEYVNGKGRRALQAYRQYGYVPMDEPVKEAFHKQEQVSRTLEYGYDDYVLGQLAKALGHQADADTLLQRSRGYRHVYDPSVGYVRGRYADGSWYAPYDSRAKLPFITEGTPRQYTWYVPHDIAGLQQLMGGPAIFERKLDTLFAEGEYWHGNEPGHHIPFLYNYVDRSDKTAERVRHIMEEEYGIGPGGLSGNDDSGQMSAWYVFAAMGMYPVAPGTPEYAVFPPAFQKITLLRPDGKTITLESKAATPPRNPRLGQQTLQRPFVEHDALLKAGQLTW